MKYYSGRGDDGRTDIAGKRIEKDDNIIELIGNLDELNAFLVIVLHIFIIQAVLPCYY